MNISSDIIITGVTPAGLTAALHAAAGGAKITLVDFATKPPANDILVIYPSSLEALDQIGAAAPLLAKGSRITTEQFWYRDAGQKMGELAYTALNDVTRFPYQLACRFADVIETLKKLALSNPNIQVLENLTPGAIEQSETGIHLTCQAPEVEVSLSAAHAILTHEGGHELAGIGMEYLLTDHHFLVAECETDPSTIFEGIGNRALLLGEGTLASLTRLGDRTRLVYQFPQRGSQAPTDGIDVKATLDGLLGENTQRNVLSIGDVTLRHYIADGLVNGRICLAGGAAYCFDTPITSIGVNAQIQDGDATAHAILGFGTEGPGTLLAHDTERQAANLRLLGAVSNAYYDITANSAQDLRFGKFEIRLAELSKSPLQARNFLMQQNLMPPNTRELTPADI